MKLKNNLTSPTGLINESHGIMFLLYRKLVRDMKTKRRRGLLRGFCIFLVLALLLTAGAMYADQHIWGFDRTVSADEQAIRLQVVQTAEKWLGAKESDRSHVPILDVYNSHTPLARGYAMKETDAWCSAFASAISIQCGLTEIIPTEVGCERHIERFMDIGAWEESDSYVPLPGDYIFYSWDPCTCDDCTCGSDHVGIVVGTFAGWIKVIEGNKADAVGYRYISVNHKTIRGYGLPDYGGYIAVGGV